MTHVDNLKSILDLGGILCKNKLKDTLHIDIALPHIQDKRIKKIVPATSGSTLHDYVPFYFWGQTPMLLVNKQIQNKIIFLVSYVETIIESKIDYVFTDRHPVIKYATFYQEIEDLKNLDMECIKARYWTSDINKPDRKEKKQAEFLVYQKVPWDLIRGIGVINNDMVYTIQKLIEDTYHRPNVKVTSQWYY